MAAFWTPKGVELIKYLFLAGSVLPAMTACRHARNDPPGYSEGSYDGESVGTEIVPDYPMQASMQMLGTPDTLARAEVVDFALAVVRHRRVRVCLLRAASTSESLSIAYQADGTTQAWIGGENSWNVVTRCADQAPDRSRIEAARFAEGRVTVKNVVLERVPKGGLWVAISTGSTAAEGQESIRTLAPQRISGIPETALAWLHLDRRSAELGTGWPAALDVWLTRSRPGWVVTLRFAVSDDTQWAVRDRIKTLMDELSKRFSASDLFRAEHTQGYEVMEVLLSEASLQTAWESLLEVARNRRLPPAQPTVVRSSPLSYIVLVSDVANWRTFNWWDVHLQSTRKRIVVRYTEPSPLAAIGIMPVDTIVKINDMDIRSPEDMEDAVFAAIAQNLTSIEVLVRRRRNFVTLRYELVR